METRVGEEIYIQDFRRRISGIPGGMELLNKIYRLVQAGRCLFYIFCDDKFEQSEADRRVFRKFENGKAEIMVFRHVDNILAHAQATMEKFAAELGETFKVNSMVEKLGVEKARKTPASGGCQPFLQVNGPQTREEGEEDMLKFPHQDPVGVLVWTAAMMQPYIACAVRAVARFWNPGPAHH